MYGASGETPVSRILNIRTSRVDGCALVWLGGEMDITGVIEASTVLRTALVDGESRLVVDVTDLAFIDASGLQVLVSAARQATQCGGWLCLVGARDLLRRMLRIVHLTTVLPVYDTVQAALAANGLAAGQLLRQGSDG